ncbi:unnamed protein product, partial [Didymodactylos carnosus]
MPNYKLYYFNGRGRAEVTRLIFAAVGQTFEDIRIEKKDWPIMKYQTPLGTLPILHVDNTIIVQSKAIARYAAQQCNLVGRSSLDEAKVNGVVDTMNDLTDKFTQKYFELKDETAKAQGKHQLLTTD